MIFYFSVLRQICFSVFLLCIHTVMAESLGHVGFAVAINSITVIKIKIQKIVIYLFNSLVLVGQLQFSYM